MGRGRRAGKGQEGKEEEMRKRREIAARIEGLLEMRGWSVPELARRSGLSQSGAHKVVTMQVTPRETTLRPMASAFGVSYEWLLTGEDPPPSRLTDEQKREWISGIERLRPSTRGVLQEVLHQFLRQESEGRSPHPDNGSE